MHNFETQVKAYMTNLPSHVSGAKRGILQSWINAFVSTVKPVCNNNPCESKKVVVVTKCSLLGCLHIRNLLLFQI